MIFLPLIECNEILDNRSEIPTPEVALCHPHLKPVAKFIPKLDSNAQILLLLGIDLIRPHKARQQISGPHNYSFSQRLDLGWVLIGEVCYGNAHKSNVNSFSTNVLKKNGRPSFLTPCPSHISLKEKVNYGGETNKPNSITSIRLLMTLVIQCLRGLKMAKKCALSFEGLSTVYGERL